jgi:hypothetical protein
VRAKAEVDRIRGDFLAEMIDLEAHIDRAIVFFFAPDEWQLRGEIAAGFLEPPNGFCVIHRFVREVPVGEGLLGGGDPRLRFGVQGELPCPDAEPQAGNGPLVCSLSHGESRVGDLEKHEGRSSDLRGVSEGFGRRHLFSTSL